MTQVISSVKALLQHNGKYLILKEPLDHGDIWDLPGGKMRYRSWKAIVDQRVRKLRAAYAKQARTTGETLSLQEARIAVMVSGLSPGHGLLNQVLDLYTPEKEIQKEAYALFVVMLAFNAALPWNKTGENSVTLDQVSRELAKEASAYIQMRLDGRRRN